MDPQLSYCDINQSQIGDIVTNEDDLFYEGQTVLEELVPFTSGKKEIFLCSRKIFYVINAKVRERNKPFTEPNLAKLSRPPV